MAVQNHHSDSTDDAEASYTQDGQPPGSGIKVQNAVVQAAVFGNMVQAHTITGGVHHHHHCSPPTRPVPRQLRPAPYGFVGRLDHFADLDRRAPTSTPSEAPGAAERRGATMTGISVIGGTGGIGKTWLALAWAHRNLHRFPDGQLFVDLHGFSPTGPPAHPVDVLGGFLDALGVDRDHQTTDPDRRAELYRSLVADKRMLIVLDNAATTDQVDPLLPGGSHCTVLITSRNHLRGLVARYGARLVHLDVLTNTESRTLLTTALRPDRVTANAPAIGELIGLCGGFPLVLGLLAARATNPRLPLCDIVAELRAVGLDALDCGDPTASLPAVLSWSLRHLTDQQRQVFALLSIAPGPDTSLPAVARLTSLSERAAHAVLRALADASLIDRSPGGRHSMHDLVRAYAISVADDLPAVTRRAALRRVLDFYTNTAHAADRLLDPHRDPARLTASAPDIYPHPLPDAAAALEWFDTEHVCLLAAQRTAAALTWHVIVWQLAWTLETFHFWRGHRHNRLTAWQAAAEAATHLHDPTARTLACQYLGLAHANLDHHDAALDYLCQALALAEHHHAPLRQAHAHHALGSVWGRRGHDRRALEHARRALCLFRSLDQPVGEADALNGVGWYTARLGDCAAARRQCQAALALHRRYDNVDGEAATLDSLGYIAHCSDDHHQALNYYRQAFSLRCRLGDTYEAANTLDRTGHPHAALGQTEQARTVWREVLQLYREQGRHDDAARVQRQIDNLDTHDYDQPDEYVQ